MCFRNMDYKSTVEHIERTSRFLIQKKNSYRLYIRLVELEELTMCSSKMGIELKTGAKNINTKINTINKTNP